MNQKTIILAVVIFVLLIVGMFGYTFLKRSQMTPNPPVATSTAPATATTSDPYASITTVTAKHFYINGVHTVAGTIDMPTPCDLLQSTATATDPSHILVKFSVINTADTCAQKITAARFKVSATGTPDAQLNATFNGRPVILNLVPPAPGETPDSFELFMKG